jgi:hypothetical protein
MNLKSYKSIMKKKLLKCDESFKLITENILHYQKIIVAFSETSRIMKEIDTIEI